MRIPTKFLLSHFKTWSQKEYATDWVLQAENLGACCSIDETSLCNAVYTIVSNKEGHGKKGSVILPQEASQEQEGTQRTQAHTQTEIQANAAGQW